ncbi:hypothetical protein M407DRAFT_214916 [Tulasnella calospora MUT 4182]|uniref:Uncharacterized protein n=1 Tax=Tulasnella calospora MUT 4182 TaxID=1051891 RepID=A0A0C3KPA2_9AGAM|nr:hypothetical protein M407DRAFT_214916 [Tulasnella calospora MUT 4182]
MCGTQVCPERSALSLKYFSMPVTDTHEDQEREWYLLLDFDCYYTDVTGKARLLPRVEPTKDAIMVDMASAASLGPEVSFWYPKAQYQLLQATFYRIRDHRGSFSASRNLPSFEGRPTDLQRGIIFEISGQPTSGIRTYYCPRSSAGELPYVCDGSTETDTDEVVDHEQELTSQRVVVTAARVGEAAGTVRCPSDRAVLHGALTWFMIAWISKHPEANAVNVAQRLKYICGHIQHPRISARRRSTGPFQLLPRAQTSFGQWLEIQK